MSLTSPRARSASIADVVLATATRAPARRSALTLGWLLSLGVHLGGYAMAARLHGSAPPPVQRPPLEIALDEPLPPTRPEPSVVGATPHAAAKRAAAPARVAKNVPAQASAIVAREPTPDEPLDFGGDVFIAGTASAYAGGVTAANGTSTRAVPHVALTPSPPSAARSAGPLARPVALADDEWQCPWPPAAQLREIDHETVTLRAHVDAGGHATSVKLIEDPGSGFGAAARTCALHTQFSPARDQVGRQIAADSPPIRVRFTR